jgi:hypothetical protein
VAIVVGVALVCTACKSKPKAAPEPPLGVVRTNLRPTDLVLPLDAFKISARDRATIETAQDNLVKKCMGERGFEWKTLPRPVEKNAPNGTRYFVFDPAAARTRGYHPAPSTDGDAQLALQQSRHLSPAEDAAFFGAKPGEGCLADAQRTLTVDSSDVRFVDSLDAEAYALSKKDSRTDAAFAAWSRCMKASGFDYKVPADANNDPRWGSDVVSDTEKQVAQADVRCKLSENVVGTWFAVETAYQQRAVDAHAQQLAEVRRHLDASKVVALRIARDAG